MNGQGVTGPVADEVVGGQVVGGQVVAVVPAKDEEERIGSTLASLLRIPEVAHVVVVDDGSSDQTAAVAEWVGGVEVVSHGRNRGKAAAMETGAARAAELAPGAPVLFVDADLQSSAANVGVLVGPVLAGEADLTIAVLPPQDGRRKGGFGIVVRTAREGITRLTGWTPTQPLSGQRCITREALDAALPFAPGWGVEVGMTIDVLRAGLRVHEVPCHLQHRVTGRDLASQAHRARQLADVTRALADRSGAPKAVVDGVVGGAARASAVARGVTRGATRGAAEVARGRGGRLVEQVRRRAGGTWHHL
ncbi:glycosyltransferase family 2 protein [Ornithinimicrobium panacihumi]|uniref:glycosyltransferase family 2 protein n=1 Tax=Ornithinimicrobium panacihumi TaxID=2008449 RepID=UPI003F8C2D65